MAVLIMSNNSCRISCTKGAAVASVALVILWICGCGDFFAEKASERQTTSILQDLSRIQTVPDPNIPLRYPNTGPSRSMDYPAK